MTQPPQQDVYGLNPRPEVARVVPLTTRNALDVGCGLGGFAVTLREVLGPDVRLVGVEAVPQNAEAARHQGFDEVIAGYFPEALHGRHERFDLVSFNDVLEHVVDPWEMLRQTKAFLSETGLVVAAIPNIQYAPVVLDLLNGRWEYADTGILDKTHLRFFTRAGSAALFEESGYEVLSCSGANSVWGHDWAPESVAHLSPLRRKATSVARGLVTRMRPESAFLHYVVQARPR